MRDFHRGVRSVADGLMPEDDEDDAVAIEVEVMVSMGRMNCCSVRSSLLLPLRSNLLAER